jgi:hypothetical protein
MLAADKDDEKRHIATRPTRAAAGDDRAQQGRVETLFSRWKSLLVALALIMPDSLRSFFQNSNLPLR